jgi:polysaccharide export outer membrane protein
MTEYHTPNLWILALMAALTASSCVQHKVLVSFPEDKITVTSADALFESMTMRVQPNDLLRINVGSFDWEAARPFNLDQLAIPGAVGGQINPQFFQGQQGGIGGGGVPGALGQGPEAGSGYLVDEWGYINFPVLGRLKVDSLTVAEVEEDIKARLQIYLKDPVVTARFLNLKVSMLGEVARPGFVRFTNPRTTLLEAIGLAGDFTYYANRTNILIIREENGKRNYYRVNLQDNSLITSPCYYLKQNDLVYVEPIRARVATVQDPFSRALTYGTTILSVLTIVLTLVRTGR